MREPEAPPPPLLMEGGSVEWERPVGSKQGHRAAVGRGCRAGRGARTRGGSLALPVALRPLRSGSPFSQAPGVRVGVGA